MSNIAKISIKKHNSNEEFLYDLDKSLPLSEIMNDICLKSALPRSHVYGLKLIRTKENVYINTYLSEETYKDVQHSDCLKISFSIQYLLNNRILPHIASPPECSERSICYEKLTKLASDPVFIDELVKDNKHIKFINNFIINPTLTEYELLALLIIVCHLFRKNLIVDTSADIISKTIEVFKTYQNNTDLLKYCLSIFHKVLINKDHEFTSWKQQIIKMVPIMDVMALMLNSIHGENLHYNILLMINTVIRLCKGDQKIQYIKEMNMKQYRDNIYKHIICRNNLDWETEHELYVLQTYILSLYKDALHSEININDNNIVTREDFEICDERVKKVSILIDFDEGEPLSSTAAGSVENLLSDHEIARMSFASMLSVTSDSTSSYSRHTSINLDYDNLNINYLTLEALKHFKANHYKIFYQSQIEEKVYQPGIFVTSEKVVKMLARILHIGKESPDSRSVFFQPIVFNCSSRLPFLLELFSRTMWLLSRTRREMKVSNIDDYSKLLNVVHKQLKMVLEKRPKDFKNLTDLMTETNFDVVLKQWEREQNAQMEQMLKTHPCILELKSDYYAANKKYLVENRIGIIKDGEIFPKIFEKKKDGYMFVQLSKNEQELLISDYDKKTNTKGQPRGISVKDITHIAVGQNCKHHHLCKSSSLAFSVIYGSALDQVNFIAENEKAACYWIDALNLLKGLDKKSEYYQNELDNLVEMDVRLKILELQHFSIPKSPPIIPPLPDVVKPPLPPKPIALQSNVKRKYRF